MGKTEIVAEPGTQSIEITREFAAPRELVFRAWTDPELIVKWLGGKRMKLEIDTYEVRDGGRWRYVHTDENGTAYAFRGVFHGTPSPDNFTQTFEFEGWPGQVSLETITFEDQGDRTRVHMRSIYPSVEARDAMIESGMEEGLNAGLDQLDEVLAELVGTPGAQV